MRTVLELIKLSTDFLEKKQIENPRRQVEEILANILGVKRMDLYLKFDKPLTEAEIEELRRRLLRRAKREPVQYIEGQVEFYHCTIKVTPDVLIPRQETEILVDKIVKELSSERTQGKKLLDLCCGSGCIGIAIKKHLPELKVIGSDISAKAVNIAHENAKRNNQEIEFREGDSLQPLYGESFDYVVCNPPYLSNSEFENLEAEVKNYEPHSALVAGPSGLEFYRLLSEQLPKILNPHAKVWLEIGYRQQQPLFEIFSTGFWKNQKLEFDWSGNPRFFSLEIE